MIKWEFNKDEKYFILMLIIWMLFFLMVFNVVFKFCRILCGLFGCLMVLFMCWCCNIFRRVIKLILLVRLVFRLWIDILCMCSCLLI